MKKRTLVLILTLAILVHAVGQTMGFLESWQIAVMKPGAGVDYRGFFATVGANDIIVKGVGLLFVVASVGFLVAMYSFYRGLQWWRPVVAAMSVLSIVIFSLWWETIPVVNLVGIFSLNVILLLAVFLLPRPATSHSQSTAIR